MKSSDWPNIEKATFQRAKDLSYQMGFHDLLRCIKATVVARSGHVVLDAVREMEAKKTAESRYNQACADGNALREPSSEDIVMPCYSERDEVVYRLAEEIQQYVHQRSLTELIRLLYWIARANLRDQLLVHSICDEILLQMTHKDAGRSEPIQV